MTTIQAIKRRDRWADWAVVALVVIALILGAVLRETTLSRAVGFTLSSDGISGASPAGWVREFASDPLLRTRDPRGGAFNTTLELRSRPLAADADLAVVLDTLAFKRGGDVAAYKTLNTDEVLVNGEVALRRTFTYVYEDQNPYVDRLPVVVKGVDLALRDTDGRAIVVTFLAGADDFAANYRYFSALVESLQF